jgi:hypothetical protein
VATVAPPAAIGAVELVQVQPPLPLLAGQVVLTQPTDALAAISGETEAWQDDAPASSPALQTPLADVLAVGKVTIPLAE